MVFFPSSTFPAFSPSVLQSCSNDCRALQPRDPFRANGRAPNTELSEASQSAQLMVGVEKGSPGISFPFDSIPLCIPLFIFPTLWPVTVSPKPTFIRLMKLYKAKVSQYTDRGSDNNSLAKKVIVRNNQRVLACEEACTGGYRLEHDEEGSRQTFELIVRQRDWNVSWKFWRRNQVGSPWLRRSCLHQHLILEVTSGRGRPEHWGGDESWPPFGMRGERTRQRREPRCSQTQLLL